MIIVEPALRDVDDRQNGVQAATTGDFVLTGKEVDPDAGASLGGHRKLGTSGAHGGRAADALFHALLGAGQRVATRRCLSPARWI